MTDIELKELTEFLAIEVMGWKRIDVPADGRAYDWCWLEPDGSKRAVVEFEPLNKITGHNHMALVRTKMREKGYVIWLHYLKCLTLITVWPLNDGPQINTQSHDGLIAEALAIKEAVEKERMVSDE